MNKIKIIIQSLSKSISRSLKPDTSFELECKTLLSNYAFHALGTAHSNGDLFLKYE